MSSRFGVLGSPIGHSLSPNLHRAVIERLGVDAVYERFDVTEESFPSFLEEHSGWEGFSLTMPLKHTARGYVASECTVSSLAGAINTIVRRPEGWIGFNTDVWGAQQALTHNLEAQSDSVVLLGAGATARSMLVALNGLGVRSFTVMVRDVTRVEDLMATASLLDIKPVVETIGTSVTADLLVNTLPGTVLLDDEAIEAIDTAALFDVVYDPWPTRLASEWSARGLPVVSGKWMLVWQALRQARIFYGDDADDELPDEAIILTSMRASVGL